MSASMTSGDVYRRQIIVIITCLADDRAKNSSINLPSGFDALPSAALFDRGNIRRAWRDRKQIGNRITTLAVLSDLQLKRAQERTRFD